MPNLHKALLDTVKAHLNNAKDHLAYGAAVYNFVGKAEEVDKLREMIKSAYGEDEWEQAFEAAKAFCGQ